jgi:hypothetical protein
VLLVDACSSHAGGYRLSLKLRDEKDYEPFSTITKRKKGKAGGRYRMFLMDKDHPRQLEVWFLGWSMTNTGGAKIKFDLANEDDFAFFRALPVDKLWHMAMVELQENDEILDQHQREVAETVKGGPKSQLAGRLCAESNFQRFVASKTGKAQGARATPDDCANFIRQKARIGSRRELDHDPDAFERFNKWVQRPYAIWSTPR